MFPHVAMPLLVGRARSLAAITAASEGAGELLLVTQRNAEEQHPSGGTLHRVGVVARIEQVTRLPNGTTRILVDARQRVLISRFSVPRSSEAGEAASLTRAATSAVYGSTRPYPLLMPPELAPAVHVGLRHVLSLFEEYAGLQRRIPAEIVGVLQSIDDPERLAYGIAAHLQVPIDVRQELLGKPSLEALVGRLTEVLVTELELLRLVRRFDEQVRG